jgi:hypothetical protein
MPNLSNMAVRTSDDVDPSQRYVTLILVRGEDAWFATGKGDKRELVADQREHGGLLIAAWTGQYKTDIFAVDVEKLRDI